MSQDPKAGKKRVLVIAVSDYDEGDLPDLDFCKKDGEQMIDVLKAQKYEIATEQNVIGKVEGAYMKNKIYEFFGDRGINGNDTVLFYYSGHGVVSRSGEVHLTSSNIDPKSPNKLGFSFSELTNVMNDCISQRVVSILDCCYSGGARVSKGVEDSLVSEATSIIESKSRNLREGVGKVLLTASLGSQEAYPTKKGDHSFFTYYLIEGLKGADGKSVNNDGTVTPSSLIEYIQAEIDKLPPKEKPYQNPLWKGEITGKIILAIHERFRQPHNELEKSREVMINELQRELENLKWEHSQMPQDYKLGKILQQAESYYDNGWYAQALDLYDKAIIDNPNSHEPIAGKGLTLLKLGRYEDAIKFYDEFLDLYPEVKGLWVTKGMAFDKLHKYKEAIKRYDRVIMLDPEDANAWYRKGQALKKLGEYGEAIECFRKMLSIDPEDDRAKDAIEALKRYRELGKSQSPF